MKEMREVRKVVLKQLRDERKQILGLENLPVSHRNQLSIWYHQGIMNALRYVITKIEDQMLKDRILVASEEFYDSTTPQN